MKKSFLFLAALLLAAPIISSCGDDDKNGLDNLTPDQQAQLEAALNKKTDDLGVLQVNFVKVDSVGNFLSRNNGAPLTQLNADTTHLFVGVENLKEASALFVEWLGLSDESQLVKMGNNLTYTSSFSGKMVHFNESSESIKGIKEIANITFDRGALKHVSMIHFIPVTMWPSNDYVDSPYVLFSTSEIENAPGWFTEQCNSKNVKWLCIREAKAGQCGVLISMTDQKYKMHAGEEKWGAHIPNKDECHVIANITKADWPAMKNAFKQRLGIEVADGDYYWADDYVFVPAIYEHRRAIRLKDGYYDWFETGWSQPKHRAIIYRTFNTQSY